MYSESEKEKLLREKSSERNQRHYIFFDFIWYICVCMYIVVMWFCQKGGSRCVIDITLYESKWMCVCVCVCWTFFWGGGKKEKGRGKDKTRARMWSNNSIHDLKWKWSSSKKIDARFSFGCDQETFIDSLNVRS